MEFWKCVAWKAQRGIAYTLSYHAFFVSLLRAPCVIVVCVCLHEATCFSSSFFALHTHGVRKRNVFFAVFFCSTQTPKCYTDNFPLLSRISLNASQRHPNLAHKCDHIFFLPYIVFSSLHLWQLVVGRWWEVYFIFIRRNTFIIIAFFPLLSPGMTYKRQQGPFGNFLKE